VEGDSPKNTKNTEKNTHPGTALLSTGMVFLAPAMELSRPDIDLPRQNMELPQENLAPLCLTYNFSCFSRISRSLNLKNNGISIIIVLP
jgi:hypothetical protein